METGVLPFLNDVVAKSPEDAVPFASTRFEGAKRLDVVAIRLLWAFGRVS